MNDPFAEATARPAWLVTLADLALLLVGFFVLLQAHRPEDRAAVTREVAAAFGAEPAPPLPVAAVRVDFAAGSATPFDTGAAIRWARDALADPRVALRVAGATDGSTADRDPATGSATLLAADRARAVAAALSRAGLGHRLSITTAAPATHARAATVTLAFAGEQEPQP